MNDFQLEAVIVLEAFNTFLLTLVVTGDDNLLAEERVMESRLDMDAILFNFLCFDPGPCRNDFLGVVKIQE